MSITPCFLHFPTEARKCEQLLQYKLGLVSFSGLEYWPILFHQGNAVQLLLFEALPRDSSKNGYYYRLQESILTSSSPFGRKKVLVANVMQCNGDPFENQELPWFGLRYIKGRAALKQVRQHECFVSVLGNQVRCGGVHNKKFVGVEECPDEFFIIIQHNPNVIHLESARRRRAPKGR